MHHQSFEYHLSSPFGLDFHPDGAATAVAGGAACGDHIAVSLVVEGQVVTKIGFSASGCPTMTAVGSVIATIAEGESIFECARIGTHTISDELGGLSPGKIHAADLAADAFARALGTAVARSGQIATDPKRTLVAMSGGVDSAVAAVLVARDSREVVSVTLQLWSDPANDEESSCCSARAVVIARSMVHALGLPHFTLDLRDEFRTGVVEPYLADHKQGLTPNPCIRCNGNVRLDAMLDFADRIGAADLATGHYARITPEGLLRAARDPAKDQAYMLSGLSKKSIGRMRFPLGEFTKPEIREIARDADLPVADRRDSQDLCFLAGTDRAAFFKQHAAIEANVGPIVDSSGNKLGEHSGYQGFTVGQRKGLGIAAQQPIYVISTDASSNTVTVGGRSELDDTEVVVRDVWLHVDGQTIDGVKLRYRSKPIGCQISESVEAGKHSSLTCLLDEPVFAVAPGQTAVLLCGDTIAGQGTIVAGRKSSDS